MYKNLSLEPSFVLHSRPYKETSILLDIFTRNYGRLSVIAKGAKRPKSNLGVIKTPSCMFLISCSGRSELKTLTHCEIKEYFNSSQQHYTSLVYLNELVVRLLEKEDPHTEIFDEYLLVCRTLHTSNKKVLEKGLRRFELILLKEIGYGIDLRFEANSNTKIKPESYYHFDPEVGFTKQEKHYEEKYQGKDILNFSEGMLDSADTLIASKGIMRKAIDFHLGDKPLRIRDYLLTKRN